MNLLHLFIVATFADLLAPVHQQLIVAQEFSDPSSHLAHYDAAASSSSFGEPVFRLEPPSSLTFASSRGATLLCLASGSPQPSISWYSSWSAMDAAGSDAQAGDLSAAAGGGGSGGLQQTSKPVANVTNLLQIVQNGAALRFLPFKEADFRPEIHSTEYRCAASNYLATIHSRGVLVQAGKCFFLFTFSGVFINSSSFQPLFFRLFFTNS